MSIHLERPFVSVTSTNAGNGVEGDGSSSASPSEMVMGGTPHQSPSRLTARPKFIKRCYLWLGQNLTFSLMLLFALGSLLIAVSHGLFFLYLNGSETENRLTHYNDGSGSWTEGFNPRKYDISEENLNNYISNVAISALSLNLSTSSIPVNYTEYRTSYHFSDPLYLVLPYSITVFLCFTFVAIGFRALHQNGCSASDGGFLQIVTAVIGRSKMEELIVKHHFDINGDNVPKEVLKLKIRYGELVDEVGVGTGICGFGTEQEIKQARRR